MSAPTGTTGKVILWQYTGSGWSALATLQDDTGSSVKSSDIDIERDYSVNPIIYPNPGDDAGGINIQISTDDILTVSGEYHSELDATPGIGSGSTMDNVYEYFKKSPYAEVGAYLSYGTKVWGVQPKTLWFQKHAGKKALITFRFIFNVVTVDET